MKSTNSSKSNSPTKSFNCDFSTDPHAEFEAELNRCLGKNIKKLKKLKKVITARSKFR